jgi:acyl carrier protein
MLDYYKTVLEKVSFDIKLLRKEYFKTIKRLNKEDIAELIDWLNTNHLINKYMKIEIYEKLETILIEMGVSKSSITENTTFEKDLGFDYLDIADLALRIESEFNVRFDGNIYPGETYNNFESIISITKYLEKYSIKKFTKDNNN